MRAVGVGQAKTVGVLGLRVCDVHVCACARIHPRREGEEREREIPTDTTPPAPSQRLYTP